jgi:hypothetical protein
VELLQFTFSQKVVLGAMQTEVKRAVNADYQINFILRALCFVISGDTDCQQQNC